MKIRLFYLLFFLMMLACSKSNDDGSTMGNDTTDMTDNNGDNTNSQTTYQGDFVSGAHTTSGLAKVNEDHTTLSLTDFITSNGPVVEVYLATDLTASNYISLGALQGINGNYDYDLPSNVNFENYKYVIIWCVEFSVNFGYAILE